MSNSQNTDTSVQLPGITEYFWNWDELSDRTKAMQPPVNLRELSNKYELKIAAPGFKRKDFIVELEHGQMTIRAENNTNQDTEEDNFSRKEFSCSSISGTFTLPEHLKGGKINAKYKRGILTIDIKKPGNGAIPKQKIKIR